MNVVSKYLSLVKFSHTLFALPFAMVSYVYALVSTGTPFDWLLLVKILLCMVFARNSAMAFNRWADRRIDAANPRTSSREIPAGKITPRAALTFVIINCILFVATAAWINKFTFILSPVALLVLLGYSYTKRFTAWAHVVLGIALCMAPIGAYIAVTGQVDLFPLLLAGVVITWVSGFDILYSLQDMKFDRENALHSVPARFSPTGATVISILLHVVSLYGVITIGMLYRLHYLYWIGVCVFGVMLVIQHIISRPSRTDKIGASFGVVNGIASLTYAAFTIADMILFPFIPPFNGLF